MTKWVQRVGRARPGLELEWSPERASLIAEGLGRKRRRARLSRAVAAGAVLLGVGLWASSPRVTPSAPAAVVAAAEPPTTRSAEAEAVIRFDDGSTATLLTKQSRVSSVLQSPGHIQVELVEGSARFDVSPNPGRLFQVTAGTVQVEVVGTRFVVERTARVVRTIVERGTVRVRGQSGEWTLNAGEQRTLELAPRRGGRGPETGWRALARQGDYEGAYRDLSSRGGTDAVEDSVDDLLLASDVARLSHNPSAAVAPLERILRDYRDDARAPLAAFTLGRVLLDDLGVASGAADAFSRAVALQPSGPLAEDAAAREVESRARAGQVERARELAIEFEKKYPTGRRLKAVRQLGRLE